LRGLHQWRGPSRPEWSWWLRGVPRRPSLVPHPRRQEQHVSASIWIHPGRMGGQPCLMYTRLPVGHAARHIAAGYDLEQYRDWYPNGLTDRDILAAVAWWVLNDRSRRREDRKLRK